MFPAEYDALWWIVVAVIVVVIVGLVVLAFTLGIRSLRRGKTPPGADSRPDPHH
jgi:hypothetical protein